MFKSYTNWQRFQLAMALLIVFLLVFATNRLDRRHFITVQNTVTSVFEDRVVAQNYIYELNKLFHEKRMAIEADSSLGIIASGNKDIQELISAFSETKLTKREADYFQSLQENFEEIKGQEEMIDEESEHNSFEAKKEGMLYTLSDIQQDLDNLAEIQVNEGRHMTNLAQKSLNMNEMLSTIEIIFLIAIGMVLQFVIFFGNKKSNNSSVDSPPNP